jgi:hypothetical protein
VTLVDDDLGTPGEIVPLVTPPPKPDESVCGDCDHKPFVGYGHQGRLMAHRISAHGFVKPARPPKKARGARKVARSPKVPIIGGATRPVTPPPPALKRKSAADFFEEVATTLGDFLADRDIDVATGRVLTLEAPLLGTALDEAVEGTRVDKWAVQPLVNGKDRFEKVAGPLGLLVGTIAVQRQPKLWPFMAPALAWSVDAMLDDLVDAYVKKAKKTERKNVARRKLADLDPVFAELFKADPDADPVQIILDAIFAPKPESGDGE